MNQDFPKVEMTFKRWVIAAVAAAIGWWALLDNGLTGLLSVGLLGLLVLASLRLGRADHRGKGLNDEFGPFDYLYRHAPNFRHNPMYRGLYPWIFDDDDD